MEISSKSFKDFQSQRSEPEINYDLRGMTENQYSDQRLRGSTQSRAPIPSPQTVYEKEQIDFEMLQQVIDSPRKINIKGKQQQDMNSSQCHYRYVRSAFEVHPVMAADMTQRHSEMNFKEWNKMITTKAKEAQECKNGFYSDRLAYNRKQQNENEFSCAGDTTPMTTRSCDTNIGNQRIVPPIDVDAVSIASATVSSVESTTRSINQYPKSRRVNLLCASLRFVYELDVLGLADVLDAVRYQIGQKFQNESENKL